MKTKQYNYCRSIVSTFAQKLKINKTHNSSKVAAMVEKHINRKVLQKELLDFFILTHLLDLYMQGELLIRTGEI